MEVSGGLRGLVNAYIFSIVVFQLLILSQSALFGILLNNFGLLQYNNGYIQHAQRFNWVENQNTILKYKTCHQSSVIYKEKNSNA